MKTRDCMGMPDVWSEIFNLGSVYPEYLSDLDILLCPSSAGGSTALEERDEGPALASRVAGMETHGTSGKLG